jgi:hypothetical protein
MYKVKGKISSIEDVKELENGAKVVNYIVDHVSENGHVTKYNIGLYKKAEYAEHVNNFVKFNKVGDEVEVEFTIRSTEYNGKIYNNLNHWKIEKLGLTTQPKTAKDFVEEDYESLPF